MRLDVEKKREYPPCKIGINGLNYYYGKVRIVYGFFVLYLKYRKKEVKKNEKTD